MSPFEFPPEIPEKKKKKIERKLGKKIRRDLEVKGEKPLFIKEWKKLTLDDYQDLLRQRNKENLKDLSLISDIELKQLFICPETLINETLYGKFRESFIYLFTLLEGFNNEILLLFGVKKEGDKSIHNIEKIAKEFNNLLNIKIELDYKFWKQLRLFFYVRNVLIHKDGVYDEKFIKKTDFDKKYIGEKIKIDQKTFIILKKIINLCFMFILIKIAEKNF